MTRKFLLMKKVKLSVLISNITIKLSNTKPFFRYRRLKINFQLEKVSGRVLIRDVKSLGK